MRSAIYSPYLDTLGGGEKYMLTVAETLSSLGPVDVLLDTNLGKLNPVEIKKKLVNRFSLDLSGVSFVKAPLGKGSSAIRRLAFLRKYDLLIYLTDGSLFYSTAKKNYIHLQTPLQAPPKSLSSKVNFKKWSKIIYNSEFTQKNAKGWNLPGMVIHPPVDTDEVEIAEKGPIILSVGRFFSFLKMKKHEVMIEAFKQLVHENKLKGWSLHFAGGVEGDEKYIDELKKLAGSLPIIFHPDISHAELVKLYSHASIYWHAMGYAEDDPTKMEHFGITTVEAMASRVVPVVINKGGQADIVTDEQDGFLWDSIDELKRKTLKLINDEHLIRKLRKQARVRSLDFSREKFKEQILKLAKS